ncbi:MAG: DUF1990 domain-containing protein [Ignavibacteriaceae bacterium]|nr:DUF1990 domain-containing protein [Ignavibacteriaceae bacterium]
MKIFLKDQKNSLNQHLEYLKTKKVMNYEVSRLTEKISEIEINSSAIPGRLQGEFLFDYQIFPPAIMIFKTEWEAEKRTMRAGDTIAQQIYLPPLRNFSQKIIFGVRIKEIIDQPDKKGFSYETLEGHVEKGISTFTLEEIQGKTVFRIHTLSKPGILITRLLAPVFSVPYQTYCTNEALKYVKRQAEKILTTSN